MRKDSREEFGDAWLTAALAELREEPPRDVDWDGLHQRIQDRAELVFARQRRQRVRFSRRRSYVPLALAASLALALWSGPTLLERVLGDRGVASLAVESDPDAFLREALTGDFTDEEFDRMVTGGSNTQAYLAAAVGR